MTPVPNFTWKSLGSAAKDASVEHQHYKKERVRENIWNVKNSSISFRYKCSTRHAENTCIGNLKLNKGRTSPETSKALYNNIYASETETRIATLQTQLFYLFIHILIL